jgi:hypothetical protein
MLGRALAEGDALGALPFLTDLISSVKQAAPGLIQNVIKKQVSAIETKYLGVPAVSTAATSVPRTTAIPASGWPSWVLPVGIGAGVIGLLLILKKKRGKR